MKSTNIYKALLALAAPFMFAACSSDEANEPTPNGGDEIQGLIVNIPSPLAATRATTMGVEEAIESLTILAYPQTSGTDATPTVKSWNESNLKFDSYTQIPMPLADGNYHVYVVANIAVGDVNFKADGDSNFSTYSNWNTVPESKLAKAELKNQKPFQLTSNNSANTYERKSIPMTCNYKAIKMQKSGDASASKVSSASNYNVVIEDRKATRVYVDLTFAVAKVRYTVLNKYIDNLQMSAVSTGTNPTSPVGVINYASTASVMDHKTSSETTLVTDMALMHHAPKYYTCPAYSTSTGDFTDTSLTTDNFMGDATPGSWSDTNYKGNWAFQDVVYVPERMFTETESEATGFVPTKLQLYFNEAALTEKAAYAIGGPTTITNSQDGSDSKDLCGVVRGVFYDLTCYTSPKDISIKVRVKKWEYHKEFQELE